MECARLRCKSWQRARLGFAAGGPPPWQYLISFTTCAQWRTPLADDVHGIPVARAAFISSLQVAITAIGQKRRPMRLSIPGSRTHGLLRIQRLSRAFLASMVSNVYRQSNLSGSLLFIRHVPWPKLIPFFLGHRPVAHDTPPEFFVLDEREC